MRLFVATVAVLLTVATPTVAQLSPATAPMAGPTAELAELRVHGNHAMTDDDIIAVAEVALGDRVDVARLAAIETRLRQSGRFTDVTLSLRYRSLSDDGPAVLIIVVEERPPIHDRLQWLPLVDYTEDHGFVVGARVAADGVVGLQEHLQLEATLGGIRAIRAAGWRVFEHRRLDRLDFAIGRSRSEHPSFNNDLVETRVGGRIARAIGPLQLGLGLGWSKTELMSDENRFVGLSADLLFDTRDATNFPRDAVYGRVGLERVDVDGPGPSVFHRLRAEGRGYKGLFGRSVLAAMAGLDLVDKAIPTTERPYLGGAESLRGYSAGSFIADNRLLTSIELRVPLGSPVGLSHWGMHGFVDSGTVWNDGRSFGSAALHHGVGIGAFLRVAFVRARIDLAHDLNGKLSFHFSTGNRF